MQLWGCAAWRLCSLFSIGFIASTQRTGAPARPATLDSIMQPLSHSRTDASASPQEADLLSWAAFIHIRNSS